MRINKISFECTRSRTRRENYIKNIIGLYLISFFQLKIYLNIRTHSGFSIIKIIITTEHN